MVKSVAIRAVLLAALAAAVGAGPAAAAPATGSLVLRTDAATGKLRLQASSTRTRTTVRVRGWVRVRGRAARLVLLRCLNARCSARGRRPGAARRLRTGRLNLDARLRTVRSALVRVELRVGARLLASVLLRPLAPLPPAPLPPAPPGPAVAAAQPAAFALSSTPALTPAYDPSVLDYSVRCQGTPVRVTATVPAGQSLTVDGQTSAGGAVVQDVALEEGQAFTFTVADSSGSHAHHVRCVPQDFPAWTVQRNGTPDVDWLIFTAVPYAIVADGHGVPVWWYRTGGLTIDTKLLPDGSVVWARNDVDAPFERHALDGRLLGEVRPVGGFIDHHDIQQLPNGDYLVATGRLREHVGLSSLGGPADATVLDAEIQEVTPAGELVWSWNSADHIDLAETAPWGLEGTLANVDGVEFYDIIHLNSFEQTGDGIVLSARHLDAVYRIRRSDGGIDWKLGGTTRPESLAFVGDPLGDASFGGQHDARILSDGTLTLHDNGTRRGRPPRALRYRLDTGARTATLLEQVGDARVPASNCCGSARRLPGGHWLMSWGMNGTITELSTAGTPVLTLQLATGFSYRAQPVSSALVDRSALHAGMEAMHPRP